MNRKLFCKHEYKTILWYRHNLEPLANYSLKTFKTQVCTRCGKVKTRRLGKTTNIFENLHLDQVRMLELQGYVTERDCLDEVQRILKK